MNLYPYSVFTKARRLPVAACFVSQSKSISSRGVEESLTESHNQMELLVFNSLGALSLYFLVPMTLKSVDKGGKQLPNFLPFLILIFSN